MRRPRLSKVFASPIEGASPTLPAGITSNPILICPFKKVPVVITTDFEVIFVPSSIISTVLQR